MLLFRNLLLICRDLASITSYTLSGGKEDMSDQVIQLITTRATFSADLCANIFRHAIELESCSNPLNMRKVL